MAWIGAWVKFGPAYWVALAVALAIAAHHVWLIRNRSRAACFRAFLGNHWLGFVIFAGVFADFALRLRAWPRGM
jgi:4-hydroxybenzoate polyprenyltransferase